MKQLRLLVLIMLISACGTAEISTPLPTPEAIYLIFPLDLKPWADNLGACAAQTPRIAVYFMPELTANRSLKSNEIALALGSLPQSEGSTYSFQVGWEQIDIIINQENDQSELTVDQLHLIFEGQATTWGNGVGQSVQVWVLPDGNPTREIFDQAILPNQRLTSEARLAPDPSAMLEAISKDINAIGYLPGAYLKSGDAAQVASVKSLAIEGFLEDEMQAAVIAITQGEPMGLMRELLVCLQADPP